jgi:hypothetical protein
MKNADETGHLDAGADLLQALARSSDGGILVIVDKPAG